MSLVRSGCAVHCQQMTFPVNWPLCKQNWTQVFAIICETYGKVKYALYCKHHICCTMSLWAASPSLQFSPVNGCSSNIQYLSCVFKILICKTWWVCLRFYRSIVSTFSTCWCTKMKNGPYTSHARTHTHSPAHKRQFTVALLQLKVKLRSRIPDDLTRSKVKKWKAREISSRWNVVTKRAKWGTWGKMSHWWTYHNFRSRSHITSCLPCSR